MIVKCIKFEKQTKINYKQAYDLYIQKHINSI